jgi:hypothetical protein
MNQVMHLPHMHYRFPTLRHGCCCTLEDRRRIGMPKPKTKSSPIPGMFPLNYFIVKDYLIISGWAFVAVSPLPPFWGAPWRKARKTEDSGSHREGGGNMKGRGREGSTSLQLVLRVETRNFGGEKSGESRRSCS